MVRTSLPPQTGRDVPTQQEHLDFVSLHHLVALELVLNLLVAGLALLVLGAHSATHFGGSVVVVGLLKVKGSKFDRRVVKEVKKRLRD